jgi:polyphosphate kinase
MVVKVNAMIDPAIIQGLYRASQAGVEIDLIVRGQCTLIPGLRGISSRIRVRSIVGRFLEHRRIFYFEDGGSPEVYLGSADWMPRNLYERVEVLLPLTDPRLRARVVSEILPAYLTDTRKARLLGSNGCYSLPKAARNSHGFSVQEHLIRQANEGPRNVAISAPLEQGIAEGKGDAAGYREEPASQATSNATV